MSFSDKVPNLETHNGQSTKEGEDKISKLKKSRSKSQEKEYYPKKNVGRSYPFQDPYSTAKEVIRGRYEAGQPDFLRMPTRGQVRRIESVFQTYSSSPTRIAFQHVIPALEALPLPLPQQVRRAFSLSSLSLDTTLTKDQFVHLALRLNDLFSSTLSQLYHITN